MPTGGYGLILWPCETRKGGVMFTMPRTVRTVVLMELPEGVQGH